MNTDALWHTTSNDNEHKDFHPFGFLVLDCLFMQNKGEDTAVRTEDLKAKQLFKAYG